MNNTEKLEILSEAAKFDLCGSFLCSKESIQRKPTLKGWIYPTTLPDGRTVRLLKILLSNDCIHNCYYCANRRDRNFQRVSFTADELVRLFLELRRKNLVDGLFLSSAVTKSPKYTMEQMLKTVEILREKHNFKGYIHLKILPESSLDYIEAAIRYADRVSVNLEAPKEDYLKEIAPEKNLNLLMSKLEMIKKLSERNLKPKSGITTQFVVGATREKDIEILSLTFKLYQEYNLSRAYFSAFQPIPQTPLEELHPTPTWREVRLYEADFLIRKYNFSIDELIFDENGNLPLREDPKIIWAKANPQFFPIEINTATYEQLLRIPGIGPISAKKIIKVRKEQKIKDIKDLKKLGIQVERCKNYILINGRSPFSEKQLSLL
ncbi:putative DNA modification/repair radical SAM protein [Dictyoglomus turgidum]|uniref:putative DNA modification/repair radical SAM protein n=1 Tax=Dictyoglomus turgidum TaxID=513050 RepID=UPI000CCF87F0|nr:putative DNA modification/repair radical SAM protein [Dictyoglomus turgidum]PNV78662.1 MAG: putative DNA modification/repair radical SAM protein [Dictyoglomus turgidum]